MLKSVRSDCSGLEGGTIIKPILYWFVPLSEGQSQSLPLSILRKTFTVILSLSVLARMPHQILHCFNHIILTMSLNTTCESLPEAQAVDENQASGKR